MRSCNPIALGKEETKAQKEVVICPGSEWYFMILNSIILSII